MVEPVIDPYEKEVENLCELITNSKLTNDQMKKIYVAIGKSLQGNIEKNVLSNKFLYKDREFLKTFKPQKWIDSQEGDLVCLLQSLSMTNTYDAVAMTRCLEGVYSLYSKNVILPLSFACNLATYLVTGSR